MEQALTATPNVANIPTVHSSAVLVELKISTWTARKKDKAATAKVAREAGASAKAGNYNKDEYSWRISNMLAQQQELGTLFDENEYPSVDELRRKFGWSLVQQPVPTSGHFSLDIPADAMEAIKEQYDEFYSKQIEGVANDIWTRLKKNLETVLRQLSPKDELDAKGNQKYNKLYDSVFDTSLDLIKMMRTFNFTNDTRMSMVASQLEDALYGVNTDALNNSETLRLEKQQEVKDIIRNLPSLDI